MVRVKIKLLDMLIFNPTLITVSFGRRIKACFYAWRHFLDTEIMVIHRRVKFVVNAWTSSLISEIPWGIYHLVIDLTHLNSYTMGLFWKINGAWHSCRWFISLKAQILISNRLFSFLHESTLFYNIGSFKLCELSHVWFRYLSPDTWKISLRLLNRILNLS